MKVAYGKLSLGERKSDVSGIRGLRSQVRPEVHAKLFSFFGHESYNHSSTERRGRGQGETLHSRGIARIETAELQRT